MQTLRLSSAPTANSFTRSSGYDAPRYICDVLHLKLTWCSCLQRKHMPVEAAKQYAAEVVLMLVYLRSQQIVHRCANRRSVFGFLHFLFPRLCSSLCLVQGPKA